MRTCWSLAMSRRYTEIVFTPTVVAAQERGGTRSQASRMEQMEIDDLHLGEGEARFLAARDSFYMASISESGWPYLQHRGGPRGFLHVIDESTLAFADFVGNRQLISTGNFDHDDRVSLFFMDYPGRQRLKVMAHGRVLSPADDPALAAQLEDTNYRARIERLFVFKVEAFDWNCPQHITPRFTAAELEEHDIGGTF
ncbi:MAG: putative pyridoxine 5'-phosphate oxidase superfamily flavin-nucleotide-binding protein [Pseudohongiellaceae bacterium]|jgi:predicted pyridoxine 5'-phosphate oxidase superfamily flavin-nucleotide-binding protein